MGWGWRRRKCCKRRCKCHHKHHSCCQKNVCETHTNYKHYYHHDHIDTHSHHCAPMHPMMKEYFNAEMYYEKDR